MSHSRTRLVILTILSLVVVSVRASSPRFFRAQNQSDFLDGETENVSIDSRGHVQLAPATELVYETAAPFLWTLAASATGDLFVGTGNEGRVFRIDGQETGSTIFDAAELEAHALAVAPDGTVYVGTSPDGRIYKVDATGQSSPFFDPDQQYIWALTLDGDGVLYAATGDKGIVYRITPDGQGEPFYEARASSVTALAVSPDGSLYIGTESPGLVLRIDHDRKGFVVLDSPFQEIRKLHFDEAGELYVAAVNGATSGPAQQAPRAEPASSTPTTSQTQAAPVPTVTVSTEITAVVTDTSGAPQRPSTREDGRLPRGAIYHITRDGLWDQVWESREDAPYDFLFDDQHRLVVGTGNQGKIFRLEGDPLQPTLLATAGADQVTALHRDADGRLYFATANPGKVFRLAATPASRGSFESSALDAEIVSTWGTISWRGVTPEGTRIEAFTRSGNTTTPDDTWSEWTAAYTNASGSPVTSPNARYLQWRIVLTGVDASPTLISVSMSYLQRNLRPQVSSITVHPPGIVFQRPFSSGDPDLAGFENQTTPDRTLAAEAMSPQQGGSAMGRRTYEKGLQTIAWQAGDENSDDLSFDLLYRREEDDIWTLLRGGLTDSIFVWDTVTVPNGTYFVRVVASDARSNAPSLALDGQRDSVAFDIDNTPPSIMAGTVQSDGNRVVATFEVHDDHSPIDRVEFSRDGLHWQAVFPVDGIGDSPTERYQVTSEGVSGQRGLTIRAIDAMHNVGTAYIDAPGL